MVMTYSASDSPRVNIAKWIGIQVRRCFPWKLNLVKVRWWITSHIEWYLVGIGVVSCLYIPDGLMLHKSNCRIVCSNSNRWLHIHSLFLIDHVEHWMCFCYLLFQVLKHLLFLQTGGFIVHGGHWWLLSHKPGQTLFPRLHLGLSRWHGVVVIIDVLIKANHLSSRSWSCHVLA